MDALRAAREQARKQMARRAQAEAPDLTVAAAGAKFEATPEQLARRSSGEVALGAPPAAKKETVKEEAPTREEGLGRLMQAKKRARDEMQDQ
jgi:hypothetical protein